MQVRTILCASAVAHTHQTSTISQSLFWSTLTAGLLPDHRFIARLSAADPLTALESAVPVTWGTACLARCPTPATPSGHICENTNRSHNITNSYYIMIMIIVLLVVIVVTIKIIIVGSSRQNTCRDSADLYVRGRVPPPPRCFIVYTSRCVRVILAQGPCKDYLHRSNFNR